MTLRLFLMRHAKSDWSTNGGDDRGRALNARGRAAAVRLGRHMADEGLEPDLAVISTARRAAETWERLAPELQGSPERRDVDELYLAPPQTILGVLAGLPAQSVLMLAHNPGMAELAHTLPRVAPHSDDFALYPTGATLIVDFEIDDWADLKPGHGEIVTFLVPRKLPA